MGTFGVDIWDGGISSIFFRPQHMSQIKTIILENLDQNFSNTRAISKRGGEGSDPVIFLTKYNMTDARYTITPPNHNLLPRIKAGA